MTPIDAGSAREDSYVKSMRRLLWTLWGIGWVLIPVIRGELGVGRLIPILMFGSLGALLVLTWHNKGALLRATLRAITAGRTAAYPALDAGQPAAVASVGLRVAPEEGGGAGVRVADPPRVTIQSTGEPMEEGAGYSETEVGVKDLSITVFEWEGTVSTEERFLLDLSTDAVQELLNIAFEYFGEESVLDSTRAFLGTKEKLAATHLAWLVQGKADLDFRKAMGLAAKKKDWFKLVDRGERLGLLLAAELARDETTSSGRTLAATEAWAYGR